MRWQSSKVPRTAYDPTPGRLTMSCRSCTGLTWPFGYIAGGRYEDHEALVAADEKVPHEPRHGPRPEVLERERGAVKEFEHEHVIPCTALQAHQRHRKVQRAAHHGFDGTGVHLIGKPALEHIDAHGCEVGSVPPCRCRNLDDRLRHVEAAVRRQPLQQGIFERHGGAGAPCADVPR
jgi:hypothetical protein